MQEINLTADPLSLPTPQNPLPAPTTQDWGSFTGLLEEILGDVVEPTEMPVSNYQTQRAVVSPRDCGSFTGLEEEIRGDVAEPTEIPVSNYQTQRAVVSPRDWGSFTGLQEEVRGDVAEPTEIPVSAFQIQRAVVSPREEIRGDEAEPEGAFSKILTKTADSQNRRAVFLRPSPNGRGWPEGPGEGFMFLYPSPAASRHPLPSGEGLSPLSIVELPIPTAPTHLADAPARLNLAEFGVTRFVYKTEVETHPLRETRPPKPGFALDDFIQNTSSQASDWSRPTMLTRPAELQSVRLVFEPPPPPPIVRSVFMDIGELESQVRVVIRERNGSLNVQFGSANERLREDLQAAGPMLMRELQRNNPAVVTLDFSNFGSATDADRQPHPQSRAKKSLKADADFADVVETAYLPGSPAPLKSL